MPFVPTRFIHASNLRLDHQAQGVGAVSIESQTILEDCTLETFSHLIDACREQEIDFLLLSGNSFIADDFSIRARIALIEGFQKLAADQIQVFIVPGQHDPLSAWDLQYNWPANITFLSPQDRDVIDILREDKTIATLQILGSANHKFSQPLKLNQRNQLFNKQEERALSIGLIVANLPIEPRDAVGNSTQAIPLSLSDEFLPEEWRSEESNEVTVDYLALCKGTQRHTFEMHPGVAHHPGTAQGLNFGEYEQNGVTLVTVGTEAQLEQRTLRLASVRWLVLKLNLQPEINRSQLIQLMQESLQSQNRGSYEKLWMIRWQFQGSGELFDSLRSFKHQSSLSNELALVVKDRLPVCIEQSFYLQTDNREHRGTQSTLSQLFQAQLDTFKSETELPLKQLLTQATHLDQNWLQRLDSLTEQLDDQQIFNAATHNGQTWLDVSLDEEVQV
ncbi:metallophosphoesterase family protein [Gimesia algae]|uniref:Putative metallophosphoesterase YhaO n=1 Tax=Gimesia algae TaxID=2527971 RepID=A0A517VLZ4_9PLAN|nr:hypothetical protein [Gimesia algae]QDT93920.1 putative metallophosphoesterase YhaO [Gimesia algae]